METWKVISLALAAAGLLPPRPVRAGPDPAPTATPAPVDAPDCTMCWELGPDDRSEPGLALAELVDLRAEPKETAVSRVRVERGTMIRVAGHTDDRQWLKVYVFVDKGPDTLRFDGWARRADVRSISRYGFSWERPEKGVDGSP